MHICFSCKRELTLSGKPGRGEVCPACGADIKVCLNCRFYDEFANQQCREPNTEWVKEKDRGNFCEYFEFRQYEGAKGPSQKEEVEAMWREVFKK